MRKTYITLTFVLIVFSGRPFSAQAGGVFPSATRIAMAERVIGTEFNLQRDDSRHRRKRIRQRRSWKRSTISEGKKISTGMGGVQTGPWRKEHPDWKTYSNKTYGFSLRYPDEYVIMREREELGDGRSKRLYRVRFQDRKVTSWETANLEPPTFTVEIFAGGRASLRDWLQVLEWIGSSDTVESFQVEGARESLRVRKMEQLAPNEFYYVSTEKYVFRLIPLGEHGPDMLASFRLTNAQ